jgi:CheY-like chemotaxis protein
MSKILLVEDDAILLGMYRDKFVHEGFTVETAGDGEEGINKIRSIHPDIVILDLLMPEQSGFDVLKFAKGDPELKDIPIVILTNAHADGEEIVQKWGASAFLMKANTTPEEVVQRVKQLLAKEHPDSSS